MVIMISQGMLSNMRYGICAGGSHAGPEPGENGKGAMRL